MRYLFRKILLISLLLSISTKQAFCTSKASHKNQELRELENRLRLNEEILQNAEEKIVVKEKILQLKRENNCLEALKMRLFLSGYIRKLKDIAEEVEFKCRYSEETIVKNRSEKVINVINVINGTALQKYASDYFNKEFNNLHRIEKCEVIYNMINNVNQPVLQEEALEERIKELEYENKDIEERMKSNYYLGSNRKKEIEKEIEKERQKLGELLEGNTEEEQQSLIREDIYKKCEKLKNEKKIIEEWLQLQSKKKIVNIRKQQQIRQRKLKLKNQNIREQRQALQAELKKVSENKKIEKKLRDLQRQENQNIREQRQALDLLQEQLERQAIEEEARKSYLKRFQNTISQLSLVANLEYQQNKTKKKYMPGQVLRKMSEKLSGLALIKKFAELHREVLLIKKTISELKSKEWIFCFPYIKEIYVCPPLTEFQKSLIKMIINIEKGGGIIGKKNRTLMCEGKAVLGHIEIGTPWINPWGCTYPKNLNLYRFNNKLERTTTLTYFIVTLGFIIALGAIYNCIYYYSNNKTIDNKNEKEDYIKDMDYLA